MDIKVKTTDLRKALNKLAPLSRATGIPALSYAKLEATKETLKLSVSNVEVWADKQIPAEITKPGILYIDAAVFNEFASTLKAGDARLKAQHEHLTVEAGNTQATISGIVAEGYPDSPTPKDAPELLLLESGILFKDRKS